jgi:hypothetical protein
MVCLLDSEQNFQGLLLLFRQELMTTTWSNLCSSSLSWKKKLLDSCERNALHSDGESFFCLVLHKFMRKNSCVSNSSPLTEFLLKMSFLSVSWVVSLVFRSLEKEISVHSTRIGNEGSTRSHSFSRDISSSREWMEDFPTNRLKDSWERMHPLFLENECPVFLHCTALPRLTFTLVFSERFYLLIYSPSLALTLQKQTSIPRLMNVVVLHFSAGILVICDSPFFDSL